MKLSKGRIIFQCINYTILFLLMAAALYPVLYVFAASLSSFEFLAQGKVGIIPMGLTIDAYKRILSYPMIGRAYLNTIFYTVAGTAVSLLLSSLAAYPLSRRPFPGQKFMSAVVVVAMLFSAGMIPTFLIVTKLNICLLYTSLYHWHKLSVKWDSRTMYSHLFFHTFWMEKCGQS